MLTWLRWIAGSILFMVFAWIAVLNAANFVQVRILKKKNTSSIPLVGGLLGMVAFIILPVPWVNYFWWLPLLLDFGSLPLLLWTTVLLIFYARRDESK